MAVHAPANLYEHRLNATVPIPMREYREFRRIDFAIDLADEWEIHSRNKLHERRLVGVVLPTYNLETVDAVLVHGLCSTQRR